MSGLPIIGRERQLIDRLTAELRSKTYHPKTATVDTSRGNRYDVQIVETHAGKDTPTGRVARVTIELLRVEET